MHLPRGGFSATVRAARIALWGLFLGLWPLVSALATPVTFTWTGAGDGVNWTNAPNWTPAGVPTNFPGFEVTAVLPAGASVLDATSSNITITALSGTGALEVGGAKTFTVTNGFTSNGTIRLSSASFVVNSETLTNAGTLDFKAGSGSNPARLDADLNNTATMNVLASTLAVLDRSAGNYSNSGTLNMSAVTGTSFRIQNKTNDNSGFTFTNTGTMNLAGGTTIITGNASLTNAVFNMNGGSVDNVSAGSLHSVVFNMNGGSINNNTVGTKTGFWFLDQGSTLNFNGGTTTGKPVEVSNSTLNIPANSTATGKCMNRPEEVKNVVRQVNRRANAGARIFGFRRPQQTD